MNLAKIDITGQNMAETLLNTMIFVLIVEILTIDWDLDYLKI